MFTLEQETDISAILEIMEKNQQERFYYRKGWYWQIYNVEEIPCKY